MEERSWGLSPLLKIMRDSGGFGRGTFGFERGTLQCAKKVGGKACLAPWLLCPLQGIADGTTVGVEPSSKGQSAKYGRFQSLPRAR